MEKISSIVPGSKRVAAVDLASAQPVRPGAPAFGRPVGVSTVGARDALTTAQKAISEQNHLSEKRKNLDLQPKIVQDMADKFFLQKSKTARPIEDMDLRLPYEQPIRAGEAAGPTIDAEIDEMASDALASDDAPREYVPPGSYLNVNV